MANQILTAAQITNHALSVLGKQFRDATPPYYARRLYGKYTIYNKDGAIVAKGLSREQMENYMKLLQEEE